MGTFGAVLTGKKKPMTWQSIFDSLPPDVQADIANRQEVSEASAAEDGEVYEKTLTNLLYLLEDVESSYQFSLDDGVVDDEKKAEAEIRAVRRAMRAVELARDDEW